LILSPLFYHRIEGVAFLSLNSRTQVISANIEEGFGRGIGRKEYSYFLRISIGSARETKGWYWRDRQLLPQTVLDHRLALLDEIISLIATELGRQKRKIP